MFSYRSDKASEDVVGDVLASRFIFNGANSPQLTPFYYSHPDPADRAAKVLHPEFQQKFIFTESSACSKILGASLVVAALVRGARIIPS